MPEMSLEQEGLLNLYYAAVDVKAGEPLVDVLPDDLPPAEAVVAMTPEERMTARQAIEAIVAADGGASPEMGG